MNFDITAASSEFYKSSNRSAIDISLNISTKLDSTNYNGTVELKGECVKVTTDMGTSDTASVSGAPPIVIAIDLLKVLTDATSKVPYINLALKEYKSD